MTRSFSSRAGDFRVATLLVVPAALGLLAACGSLKEADNDAGSISPSDDAGRRVETTIDAGAADAAPPLRQDAAVEEADAGPDASDAGDDAGGLALSWTKEDQDVQAALLAGWAASENDIWVVGAGGVILHSTGNATWSSVTSPTTVNLGAVHGASASDVWAVGTDGIVIHWDGASWSTVASGTTKRLHDVRALSASNVWAVGDEGTILHWDGASWTFSTSGTDVRLTSVWGLGEQVWVGGVGTLLHKDGATWTADAKAQGHLFVALSGTSTTDVWAVGGSYIGINGSAYLNANAPCKALHWDGVTWSTASAGPSNACWSAWAEPGTLWAVGLDDEISVRSGTSSSSRVHTDVNLHQVFGTGARVWAVGVGGTILRLR